jgi:hypothetical protein
MQLARQSIQQDPALSALFDADLLQIILGPAAA